MKKLILYFLIPFIAISTFLIAFLFFNNEENKTLETELAYTNKRIKESDKNVEEEKKLYKFLSKMPQTHNKFESIRIDSNEESLDQTYYYIKINELLGQRVSSKLLDSYSDSVANELDYDPFSYAYINPLVKNATLSKDTYNKMELELKKQLQCSNCLTESSPYIIYYLSKNIPQFKSDKATEIIGQFILTESNEENLIYYLYWYFSLVNDGFSTSKYHQEILGKANKTIKKSSLKDYKDKQTVYILYSLSNLLKNPYDLKTDNITNSIDTFNYNFNLYDIYFSLKLLNEGEKGINKSYKKMYIDYLNKILPSKDNFYPMVAVEKNNMIDMITWQLIMDYLYDSNKTYNHYLTNYLKKTITNSKLSSSQTELYYETLFFKLNDFDFPKNKTKSIYHSLNNKTELVENYYLFQAGAVLGYKLNTKQIKQLKSETKDAINKGEVWNIIVCLDLNYTYNEDEKEVYNLWKLNKDYLEKNKNIMNEKAFFLYQILKESMGKSGTKSEIDTYFNARGTKDVLLLDGDSDTLNLSTIYSYLSLLHLHKIKRK
ncbi:hypothetical protein [Priestia aryabhattai]|uniref:hypothetical protein n=1 Tax=Priestia aryabhattai TaxID=412384 RepID=UPI0023AF8BD7|nr:hypothetical protein [Priestia aryabhattai]MDE8674683.1 hypothetical protein [Priestia aryabhattai]